MKKTKKIVKSGGQTPKRKRAAYSTRRSRLDMALHKRIILHPISIFFLLCVGVFMAGVTLYSFADSYTVHAKVSAPLPSAAASITAPADQSHVSTQSITVSGFCPANTYIKLYAQNVFSGMAVCGSSDSTYQVDTELQPGANDLYTRVFNLTDDEGPRSAAITVWYDVPSRPSPNPVTYSSPANSASTQPFAVGAEDYQYHEYGPGQMITWTVHMIGGTAPYKLVINWGDGSSTTALPTDTSPFEIGHRYNPQTSGDTVYTLKLAANDAKGATASLQLSAVVKVASLAPASGGAVSDITGTGGLAPKWLWVAWPSYGVVILMAVSFWLGERQEVFTIFHHGIGKARPHRHAR